jgi:hypothetical protein
LPFPLADDLQIYWEVSINLHHCSNPWQNTKIGQTFIFNFRSCIAELLKLPKNAIRTCTFLAPEITYQKTFILKSIV